MQRKEVFLFYYGCCYFHVEKGKKMGLIKNFFDAAMEGRLKDVKKYWQDGHNIHVVNEKALHDAALNGHLRVVRFLASKGANLNKIDSYDLKRIISNGHYSTFKFLVENNAVEYYGFCASSVVACGKISLLKLCVKHGMDVNTYKDDLKKAVFSSGKLSMLKCLVQMGMQVDEPDLFETIKSRSVYSLDKAKFLCTKIPNARSIVEEASWRGEYSNSETFRKLQEYLKKQKN